MHATSSVLYVALLASSWAFPLLETRCNVNDCPPPPDRQQPPFHSGYVAFGDSYAAGIGTGKTTWNACRQGSYSYPTLLSKKNSGAEFQNLACSGAVMSELIQGDPKSQIDQWKPDNTDLATLSITGNDVGFADILMACVLRLFGRFSKDCPSAMQAGQDKLSDANTDFHANLGKVMVQIVDKAKHPDFRLVVTGYPQFFNPYTDYCADTSFDFWRPGHDTPHVSPKLYLDKELRTNLNDLVTKLNTAIKAQVDNVNTKYGETRALFIDPNDAFNSHRFCEDGVNEPDSGRSDTWFFLSAWPDNSLPSTNTAEESAQDQEAEPAADIPDPNADECQNVNPDDLVEQMRCDVAGSGMTGTPNDVTLMNGTHAAFVNGTEEDVAWFKPTRYVKTFHPRSLGHDAYTHLIIDALKQG